MSVSPVYPPGTPIESKRILNTILDIWPNARVNINDPNHIWSNALEGVNQAQLEHGLKQLSLSSDQHAPTPGQFRARCLAYSPGDSADEIGAWERALYRELRAGDLIMLHLLEGTYTDPSGNSRFNLRGLAQAIIAKEAKNKIEGRWRTDEIMKSACYGAMYVAISQGYAKIRPSKQ